MNDVSVYELTVPKNNNDYNEFVLKRIYGFADGNLLQGLENGSINLIRETPTTYEIQFQLGNSVALINVLPPTEVRSTRKFFGKEFFYNEVVKQITDKSEPPKMYLDTREVLPLVLQLAVDNIIQKYAPLDGIERFVCVAGNVPLFIGSENGKFTITPLNKLIFDVDDGFKGY